MTTQARTATGFNDDSSGRAGRTTMTSSAHSNTDLSGADNTVAPAIGDAGATATDASDARANKNHKHGDDHTTRHARPASSPATPTSSRINPDDPRFIRSIAVGVAFAGLVAFAISFVALMEVAAWLGLPAWMHWSVPAFIDTGILVYAGSVLIHKARGERTWPSWLMLAVFTILSIVANCAHALAYGQTGADSWQAVVGAVIAGMVPVAVFTATEQLSRVAVEDPISRRRELQAAAEWHAEQAERERKQLEMEAERERARQDAELAQEQHATELAVVRAQREARAERAAELAARGTFELPTPTPLRVIESPTDGGEDAPQRASRSRSGDMDALAEFVAARTAEGLDTSGADLANEFGFSDKTGRRRLAALREERPQVFTGGEA